MNGNLNILVVDDNQENLKVVSTYLKEKNYRIALALDGKSALDILESNKIDLVLLDVMMPEMDGFEVITRIRANKCLENIPVIFLTAKNETEDIVKGFELGGVDYIPKPFRKEELFARVNCHLQLKLMKELLKENLEHMKSSRAEMMNTLLGLAMSVEKGKDSFKKNGQ
jgi:DNA-binding response OmpR family regulator